MVLEDEQVMEGLLGFALALVRLANANTSVFVVEVSCSLSSYSLSIKSVTNCSSHEKFFFFYAMTRCS